ncbi:MAG TPA: biotin--[acetyl-CoA-carboxylase] ligase [Clostridiales bacterium]|nr:biotin--[acetyl-CoA-carboxylase] ligase [Clostridiales bacterium]
MRIIELNEVDSTNEYLKRNDDGEDTIVTALRQTAGKGTKGRSFISDEGGLYVSVMRHYENFCNTQAFRIMINACVAVCKTIEFFGMKPVIRWANDVLVCGKKICGTLIENTFSGSFISRSIVGMGINVNNVLPPELKEIATSVSGQTGRAVDVDAVKRTLIKNLKRSYTLADYKSYINWLGKEITLKTDKGEQPALAVDVDADGSLICVVAGSLKKISSAEVSLRL